MTDDFLGVVQAKRFLGREFLTWLVFRAEEDGGRFEHDGDMVEVTLGDRLVLEDDEGRGARLTLTGEGDIRPEMGAGLRRGKLIDRAKLTLRRGERRWELVLDGGMLAYGSLRCPPLQIAAISVKRVARVSCSSPLCASAMRIFQQLGLNRRSCVPTRSYSKRGAVIG